MKKLILLLLFSNSIINGYTQTRIIYVRFDNSLEMTIAATNGYDFKGEYNFSIRDSLVYASIKQRVDSLIECIDTCNLPDVGRQIIILDGEKYDIVSFNKFMMEKNGKPVYFDTELYSIIDWFIRKVMKERGIPNIEDVLWEKIYKQ